MSTLGAAALMMGTSAIAQHGGGPPAGAGGGPPAGVGGMGNAGGFGTGMGTPGGISDMRSTMRDQGRLNSQGPQHASATGIAHANANSVLAGTTATTTVTAGPLAGLTTGVTLMSNGSAVGSVQQIRMTGNGSVAVVVVKGTNGGLFAIPANKLTFSGGTLTTSARLRGVNG
jgi:hypothetical protein